MRRSFLLTLSTCFVALVCAAQQPQQQQQTPPPPPRPNLPISIPAPLEPIGAPAPQTTTPAQQPQTLAHTTADGGFVLDTETTLTELITILAKQMKLNYILDPRVAKGTV